MPLSLSLQVSTGFHSGAFLENPLCEKVPLLVSFPLLGGALPPHPLPVLFIDLLPFQQMLSSLWVSVMSHILFVLCVYTVFILPSLYVISGRGHIHVCKERQVWRERPWSPSCLHTWNHGPAQPKPRSHSSIQRENQRSSHFPF